MTTNLDALSLTGALTVGGAISGSAGLSFEGGELKVTTATATANDTLNIAGLAVGDVVLGINSSTGAVGTPGAITAGAVACTQVASAGVYTVVWIDAT